MPSNQVLDRSAIKALIAAGDIIVIVDKNVLRLNSWIDRHPGGHLPLLHMVGQDATEEVNIYHSYKTLRSMHYYRIGRIDTPWTNLTPPIRGGEYSADTTGPPPSLPQDFELQPDDISTTSTVAHSLFNPIDSLTKPNEADDSAEHVPCLQKPELSTDSSEKDHGHRSAEDCMQDEIDQCLKEYPSLDAETQQDIQLKYRVLHERVKHEGYYDCRYSEYAKELARYSALFAAFLFAIRSEWYLTAACCLGLFWHQIMFTAHDAAHRGITHNFVVDTLISMFVADFCCGLSIGWWKSSHNVHHLVTNHPEHDPDIQNVPLFATCPSFFKSLKSTYYNSIFVWDAFADFAVQYQAYTYYPVMALARFNLYFLSMYYLFRHPINKSARVAWIRPTELAFVCCYWYLFGYLLVWRTIPTWTLRVLFVLTSHIITMPLHVQITLSHWGMPTVDLGPGESFPQRQLRTTMDVSCPEWLDFIHGGLQFQACHHLFPMVPRHNLRRLQCLVRQFCTDTGIPYKILGFMDGNREVLGRLGHVAQQIGLLIDCQRDIADESKVVSKFTTARVQAIS